MHGTIACHTNVKQTEKRGVVGSGETMYNNHQLWSAWHWLPPLKKLFHFTVWPADTFVHILSFTVVKSTPIICWCYTECNACICLFFWWQCCMGCTAGVHVHMGCDHMRGLQTRWCYQIHCQVCGRAKSSYGSRRIAGPASRVIYKSCLLFLLLCAGGGMLWKQLVVKGFISGCF